MKKVELKKMKIQNFRSIRIFDVDFNLSDDVVTISGYNESGKTTIYDAYIWALFGKTSHNNGIVQTIGEDNQIVHMLETSVELSFHILDDEGNVTEFTISRVLTENWKYLGTPDEKFAGISVTRYFNSVPLTEREFNDKLNAIFPLDRWQIISNIGTFMKLKVEDRKHLLLSAIGEIVPPEGYYDNCKDVLDELDKGKTVEELTKQTKATFKKAHDEQIQIPVKISAQKTLITDKDFSKLNAELSIIRERIANIEASQKSDASTSEKINTLSKKLIELRTNQGKAIEIAIKERGARLKEAEDKKHSIQSSIRDYSAKIDDAKGEISRIEEQSKKLENEFSECKEKWTETNKQSFDYTATEVCPTCGRPLTGEMKDKEREDAVGRYNENKTKLLSAYYNRCVEISDILAANRQKLNIQNLIINDANLALTQQQSLLDEALKQVQVIKDESAYSNANVAAITREIEMVNAQMKDVTDVVSQTNQESVKELQRLKEIEESLVKEIAAEDMNKVIYKQISELEERAQELSQIISDCEKLLYQISVYKKSSIQLIEDSVNQLFSTIKWKFFEENITNDKEKDICTCLYKGIDFDNLNKAAEINANIEIAHGLCKGFETSLPIWVDNSESVSKIRGCEEQQIFVLKYEEHELLIN